MSAPEKVYPLIPRIIALSDANAWPKAVKEWELRFVEVLDDGAAAEHCLCGHTPIRDLCHIANTHNGNTALVGNHCIKRFASDTALAKAGNMIASLKRIRLNCERVVHPDVVVMAHRRGALWDTQRDFYLDKIKTPYEELSARQQKFRKDLNNRMIDHFFS